MEILSQFLLRLAFGLAFGMAITSPQKVFSGFYRNHLYVTLGLATLATLVLARVNSVAAIVAGSAAALSYAGAVAWLYEGKRVGIVLTAAVCVCTLLAAWLGLPNRDLAHSVELVTSGLVLGVVFAAMLLGHWYLNAPGMELEPLRHLLMAAAISIALQMVVVGAGVVAEASYHPTLGIDWLLFLALRWSFGLFGVLGLLWMAWQTLKIPNTQSATGILYVAVIGVFIGELTGLLLSAESTFAL